MVYLILSNMNFRDLNNILRLSKISLLLLLHTISNIYPNILEYTWKIKSNMKIYIRLTNIMCIVAAHHFLSSRIAIAINIHLRCNSFVCLRLWFNSYSHTHICMFPKMCGSEYHIVTEIDDPWFPGLQCHKNFFCWLVN